MLDPMLSSHIQVLIPSRSETLLASLQRLMQPPSIQGRALSILTKHPGLTKVVSFLTMTIVLQQPLMTAEERADRCSMNS